MVDTAAWDTIQERARTRIWDGFRDVKCLAAVAPTGFGKTRLGSMLIKDVQRKGYPWVWYTHRKTLTTQTMRSFQDQGLDFGVRASGLPDFEDITKPGQIAMLQSERAAIKNGKRSLHDARFVIVDESHANKNGWAEEAIRHHLNNGDRVLQLSATPVGQGHISENLIELASMSEMLEIGALLPAECWSPSELDMKHIRKIASGEYSPGDQAKMVMKQQVVGDIMKWYWNLNPEQVPTLGFGPDVKSSMWLCDYFNDRGIKSAHIDGEKIYLGEHDLWGNPVVVNSNQKLRDQLFDKVSTGEIKVLWNRFVCLDAETEILTTDGWMGIDEMTPDHLVANWQDGKIWFSKPGKVMRRPRRPGERMVFVETPRRSIRVTEDHELLTITGDCCEKRPARELVDTRAALPVCGQSGPLGVLVPQPEYQGATPRRIASNAYRLRSLGHSPEEARMLAIERIKERESLRYKQPVELSLDECEFIGFWVGDGNKNKLKKGGIEYRLYESESYTQIVSRIEYLINSLGIDAIRKTRTTENEAKSVVWSFSRGTGFGHQKRKGLFHLEPYLEKSGSKYLWGLNEKQFESFLRGLWMANGTQHLDRTTLPGSGFSICSANESLLDLLQSIAVCRGYRASVRSYDQTLGGQLFHLSLTKTNSHEMTEYRLQFDDEPSEEEVWCVTTESQNIITRRHGSVTVMGNCREGLDVPPLGHAIFACAFGQPETWIQAVGRVLRADLTNPAMTSVKIQDHGGNLHRCGLGHPNDDRLWSLYDTNKSIVDASKKAREKGEEYASVRCPTCSREVKKEAWQANGYACPYCGATARRNTRVMIMKDGSLKKVPQKSEKKREKHPVQKTYDNMYYASCNGRGMSFNYLVDQLERQCTGYYVNRDTCSFISKDTGEQWRLGNTPKHESQWSASVKEVPRCNLHRPEWLE